MVAVVRLACCRSAASACLNVKLDAKTVPRSHISFYQLPRRPVIGATSDAQAVELDVLRAASDTAQSCELSSEYILAHPASSTTRHALHETSSEAQVPDERQASRNSTSNWNSVSTFFDRDQYAALPNHVAIILDGNHRWAMTRGLQSVCGHQEGAKALQAVVQSCSLMGIPVLTVFAFSAENWNRDPAEVAVLLITIEDTLRRNLDEIGRAHV